MESINTVIKELVDDEIDFDEYDSYYEEDVDSIDSLDFSIRTNNALKRAGITTISELKNKTEEDLMKIRNLGKKSLKEIKDKVNLVGSNNIDTNNVWFPSKYGLK